MKIPEIEHLLKYLSKRSPKHVSKGELSEPVYKYYVNVLIIVISQMHFRRDAHFQ